MGLTGSHHGWEQALRHRAKPHVQFPRDNRCRQVRMCLESRISVWTRLVKRRVGHTTQRFSFRDSKYNRCLPSKLVSHQKRNFQLFSSRFSQHHRKLKMLITLSIGKWQLCRTLQSATRLAPGWKLRPRNWLKRGMQQSRCAVNDFQKQICKLLSAPHPVKLPEIFVPYNWGILFIVTHNTSETSGVTRRLLACENFSGFNSLASNAKCSSTVIGKVVRNLFLHILFYRQHFDLVRVLRWEEQFAQNTKKYVKKCMLRPVSSRFSLLHRKSAGLRRQRKKTLWIQVHIAYISRNKLKLRCNSEIDCIWNWRNWWTYGFEHCWLHTNGKILLCVVRALMFIGETWIKISGNQMFGRVLSWAA